MENMEARKRTSVPVIIFMMFFFFPLGIYLIYRRMTEDKTEILKYSKKVNALGCILIAIGIMYIFVMLDSQVISEGNNVGFLIFLIILFIGGGIKTLNGAGKMRKKGIMYKKYISLINGNQTNIDIIAESVFVTYETAVNDLQEMINVGFFPNAYINESIGEIILPGRPIVIERIIEQPIRRKIIKCPNCGASKEVLEGQSMKCDYCDSPLAY